MPFGTESVRFVDQALKDAAYQGCILIDWAEANRENFKLSPSTATVVIDQLGLIAGYSRYADGDALEHTVRAVLDYRAETDLSETPPQEQRQSQHPAEDASWNVRIPDESYEFCRK